MNRISVSNLDCYSGCPKKYDFRVNRKPPTPPIGVLMVGSAVHKGVEAFVQAVLEGREHGAELAAEIAAGEFRQMVEKAEAGPMPIQWAEDKRSGWKDTAETAERDVRALAGLWAHEVGARGGWKASEMPLSLQVYPDRETPKLTGRLDLLMDDGLIVEVKTANSRWEQGAEDLKAQGAAYPFLMGLGMKDVRLRFDVLVRSVKAKTKGPEYFLDQRGPIVVTAARQLEYLQDLRDMVNMIENDLYPRRIGKDCRYCDYRAVCF